VNRPFYAFGMLFALLALTTLAVSSSTRSTTVKRLKARAEHSLPMKRRPGGAVFVVVLPAKQRTASKIAAARVELAGAVSSAAAHDSMECRSFGDAAYDFAVYGDLPAVQPVAPPAVAARQSNLTAEELVSVFTSLSRASHPRQSASKAMAGWTPWNLRSLALGLQNWFGRQADRLPLVWLWKQLLADKLAARAPVSWSDYADLIDETAPLAAAPRATTIRFVQGGLVRSEDGLLHSAASSLHRLALLLELAADRLEQSKSLAKAN
jgi:hypothetical protein